MRMNEQGTGRWIFTSCIDRAETSFVEQFREKNVHMAILLVAERNIQKTSRNFLFRFYFIFLNMMWSYLTRYEVKDTQMK